MKESLILIAVDDWRTRRFIRTVLKYETNAHVMEAACPRTALSMAQALDRPIDLLISEVELADAKPGLDLARQIAADCPSMRVLLMSFQDSPPRHAPRGWRFLSIPFPTAAFLDEICMDLPRPPVGMASVSSAPKSLAIS